ncbi:hypothetical protein A6X20_16355 [Bradyrhizobium elkanii]|nr:hypothetical protein A6452_39410 [Bradyrhizobium elkanii]ODM82709.1 hypothetical protein A6X20_16355 [Bradyrhizobium elkanii]
MAVVRTAMTLDRFSRVTIDQFSLDKDSHTSLQSPYSFRHNAERIATHLEHCCTEFIRNVSGPAKLEVDGYAIN